MSEEQAPDDDGEMFTYFRTEQIVVLEALADMDVESANEFWKQLGIEPCNIIPFPKR